MADGPGGYKKPAKPAAVSGPGRFAKRTDGGASQPIRDVTGGGYGDNAELRTLQGSAPMNASARTSQAPQQMPMQAGPPLTGFGEPTARPNEPVTAGNPLGPGAGPSNMNAFTPARLSATIRQIASANPDGSLDDLITSLEENGL